MTQERAKRLEKLCRDFCEYGELLVHIRLCRDLEVSQALLRALEEEAGRIFEQLLAARARFLLSLDLPDSATYAEAAQRLDDLLVGVRREALSARAKTLRSETAESANRALSERCREFLAWVETVKERR